MKDINLTNPLGMQGKLAVVYSELLKELWMGTENSVSCWEFKTVIAKKASQFSGYNQQDA